MRNLLSIFLDEAITSIVIGKFDGMHRAHRQLLSYLDEGGGIIVVRAQKENLTPGGLKAECVGIPIFEVKWTLVRHLSGGDFFAMLMQKFPRLRRIVVGYDFRCGKNRGFGALDIASVFKGEVVIVPEILYKGKSVHSEEIREFLREGKIFEANELLGRPYMIEGEIISGQGLGKRELVPTLNLAVNDFVIPKDGVYVSYTQLGSCIYDSISFVGKRASTDNHFALETHVLAPKLGTEALPENASVCLYGARLPRVARVFFLKRVRGNRKFVSLPDLKAQIATDILEARLFHKEHSVLYNIWFARMGHER